MTVLGTDLTSLIATANLAELLLLITAVPDLKALLAMPRALVSLVKTCRLKAALPEARQEAEETRVREPPLPPFTPSQEVMTKQNLDTCFVLEAPIFKGTRTRPSLHCTCLSLEMRRSVDVTMLASKICLAAAFTSFCRAARANQLQYLQTHL